MKRLFLVFTLAWTLGACTFYVAPEPGASVRVRPVPETRSQPEIIVTEAPVITDFAPTRGAGSVYGLGEAISFRVRSTESGYATLTATGPDGVASVFAQGVYLQGGTDVYLPTPAEGVSYTLAPPRGLQRVTLTLTSDTSGTSDSAETTFYIQ